MIHGRDMEEGKHIIHYLINYLHYTEGKSEPRRRAGLVGTARVFSAVTEGHRCRTGWRNPPSPQSWCLGSRKTRPKERGQTVGRVRSEIQPPPPLRVPPVPGISLILSTLFPIFLLFPHLPTNSHLLSQCVVPATR